MAVRIGWCRRLNGTWKVCLNDRTISALEDLKIVTAVKGCWGASSLMTGDMTGDSVKFNRKERRGE